MRENTELTKSGGSTGSTLPLYILDSIGHVLRTDQVSHDKQDKKINHKGKVLTNKGGGMSHQDKTRIKDKGETGVR